MQLIFTGIAMGLDTLPDIGRVFLLAILLACMLCALARLLSDDLGSPINVMYRKGVLVALLVVPLLVYFANIQLPVYVDEARYFDTTIPAYATLLFGVIWLVGAAYNFFRLFRQLLATKTAVRQGELVAEVNSKLLSRIEHWQQRISMPGIVTARCGGAELPWHMGRRSLLLPAAALNWPTGVADVVLLKQLVLIKSRCWYWLLFSQVMAAIYWPLPWVRHLAHALAEHLAVSRASLAEAAYRDKEGWRRDLRNFNKRASTLTEPHVQHDDPLLRLPAIEWGMTTPTGLPPRKVGDPDASFEEQWTVTKRRRAAKHRDPYEQAYWLIAVACLVVGLGTTLTVVQTPPEFEPTFLQLKWQDQMSRRIKDYDNEQAVGSEDAEDG